MLFYIFKRILLLLPVLIGVLFIVFSLLYLTPGDPAALILGDQATVETVAALRTKMGLDDPFFVQFFGYLLQLLKGDLGRSYVTNEAIMDKLLAAFPYTLKLSFLSVVTAMVIGIPLGIISAVKKYSWLDNIVSVFSMLGISMPVFWLGLLLILFFAVYLRVLPPSGTQGALSMILPVLTLSATSIAVNMRMTRSSMLEVMRQDFIRTARAKGAGENRVLIRHALPNALIPVLTIAGIDFGNLLGGAVLTETIFSIPGIGRLMVAAIQSRDYPLIQGGVLLISLCFCLVNLAVDLFYGFLNPQIKSEYT